MHGIVGSTLLYSWASNFIVSLLHLRTCRRERHIITTDTHSTPNTIHTTTGYTSACELVSLAHSEGPQLVSLAPSPTCDKSVN